ncbi:DNA translocase, putative [Trichomonas vaginalis G3]|uniref:DNA translocase, putative n=1 Tax=Trichomonas vaginalis (strain ATCC PRA-98 / G3) TaxID=412133 RepID=A2EKF9_TRIV3|nr:hypothetical protein TVAGG3_0979620 [Trichomonas vaginalis G3]EAY06867.1 DNA translocase, putative [Trichomonas vaginalis G3]KAI5489189.1 hypothetical protein TVAGG3_0979620 [Trichomonas vaginalis G3]|eukprot:XP_001319090.1 DNA translocase [Trichomonas vaginalis G3]
MVTLQFLSHLMNLFIVTPLKQTHMSHIPNSNQQMIIKFLHKYHHLLIMFHQAISHKICLPLITNSLLCHHNLIPIQFLHSQHQNLITTVQPIQFLHNQRQTHIMMSQFLRHRKKKIIKFLINQTMLKIHLRHHQTQTLTNCN